MEQLIQEAVSKGLALVASMIPVNDFNALLETVVRGVRLVVSHYKIDKRELDMRAEDGDYESLNNRYAELLRSSILDKVPLVLPSWLRMMPSLYIDKVRAEMRQLPTWAAAVEECPFIELV